MNTDIDRKPPDRDEEPDAPAPADGEDVIVFYDSEGKATLVLPAEDVVAIIPDRLLRPDEPSKPGRPPRRRVWPGEGPEKLKDEE